MKKRKPEKPKRNYQKVDYVLAHLNEYFKKGYKLFNLYHFRKNDELMIQLKDGNGGSESLTYNCTYPVYRYTTTQLRQENNIFESLYQINNDRCKLGYVPSDTINEIGKVGTDCKQVKEYFDPEKYLVYNVWRPEYYVSTKVDKVNLLQMEQTRVGSLDIEVVSSDGGFPEPSLAAYPVQLLSIFDFKTTTANVFYLDGHDIDDRIESIKEKIYKHMPDLKIEVKFNLMKYDNEKEMLSDLVAYMNKNYDIIVGWNLNEFDVAYIINRSKNLELYHKFGVVYDGFSYGYVFEHFVCIDFINVYKFIVKKNPASAKLNDIAKDVLGVGKVESETFLDIAYNITDNLLVYLIDEKLSLLNQMFSFKDRGSLLHVFNVRNALEPVFIRVSAGKNKSLIANQYTIYYNIYYNEVYKYINRDVLKLKREDLQIFNTNNIINFLTNLSKFEELLKFYVSKGEEKKEAAEPTSDSASEVVSKMVKKVLKRVSNMFKKPAAPPKPKKLSKKAMAEIEAAKAAGTYVEPVVEKKSDVLEEFDVSELELKKNFDYDTEEFDDILVKLYGINVDTIFGYPGAFNKSFRGIAENLIDLDFFSMYPVIMYSTNISIETGRFLAPMKLSVLQIFDKGLCKEYVDSLKDGKIAVYNLKSDKFDQYSYDELCSTVYTKDHIWANTGMVFDKEPGIVPKLCEHFLVVRAKYKNMMNAETDPVMKGKYNIYQLLYKVYNNSIYGYMGYRYSPIFNRLLVSSVTIMGRSEILYANYRINEYLGKKSNPTTEKVIDA